MSPTKAGRPPVILLIGTVFWLLATWGHSFFGYAGAGIYRWL